MQKNSFTSFLELYVNVLYNMWQICVTAFGSADPVLLNK